MDISKEKRKWKNIKNLTDFLAILQLAAAVVAATTINTNGFHRIPKKVFIVHYICATSKL